MRTASVIADAVLFLLLLPFFKILRFFFITFATKQKLLASNSQNKQITTQFNYESY